MPKPDFLEIRPIELADVPALLTIIADSRGEYGIADKGVPLLEPAERLRLLTALRAVRTAVPGLSE